MTNPDQIRYRNLCMVAAELGTTHAGQALQLLDEARTMLLPKPAPWSGRPEDDPNRPAADRAAWREARG